MTPANYKPEGYPTVSPYLIVDDAAGTIEFLTQALGADLMRTIPGAGGGVMHAEVRIGDSVVMLGESGADGPVSSAHVHVYVADVDTTYERAVAAGAKSVQAPVQKDDEDKRGGVRDAAGTTWWIATRVG